MKLIQPGAFDALNWPRQPGDYHVFDHKKSIALVLLQEVDPKDCHRPEVSSHLAIAGSLSTENLGIEHVVKNIIANPYIRHVVVWGKEVKGHFPGDALLKLKDHGADARRRIIQARGGRPVLKNLVSAEIDHFRRQIEVRTMGGNTGVGALATELDELDRANRQPYEAGLTVETVNIIQAKPAERLTLDPSGYFVIMVMKGKPLPLMDMNLVSQTDHAAYIGRELAKAEMSLQSGQKYIQDRAQGSVQKCSP